jgi:hypothetical protein
LSDVAEKRFKKTDLQRARAFAAQHFAPRESARHAKRISSFYSIHKERGLENFDEENSRHPYGQGSAFTGLGME